MTVYLDKPITTEQAAQLRRSAARKGCQILIDDVGRSVSVDGCPRKAYAVIARLARMTDAAVC